MEKRRGTVWIVLVIISILLIVLVFWGISAYTPYYHDTVIEYSDKAPRVGNNIYGYIDVPEGFVMEGSFDSENANYAGGQDGIREGVRLYDPEGTACITISILTPDRKQEDYIGIGRQEYFLCDEKKGIEKADDAWNYFSKQMWKENTITAKDGSYASATPVEVNDLAGMSGEWNIEEAGKIYHNQLYILEDPEKKGVIHCITASYQPSGIDCLDYLTTFSLKRDRQADIQVAGVGKRVGNSTTGYMNVPEGYDEYHGLLVHKLMDDGGEAADLIFCAEKEKVGKDAPFLKSMVLGRFTRDKEFDQSPLSYMQNNLLEVFGHFGVLEYCDFSNAKLKNEDSEFGAKTFVSVMEQSLGKYGVFSYMPVELEGQKGYKVTWSGRFPVDNRRAFFTYYILDSVNNSDEVYIVGAREEDNNEGVFEPYLKSFSLEK